jgi:hypothetical protein
MIHLPERLKSNLISLDTTSSSLNLYEHIELLPPVHHLNKSEIDPTASRFNRLRVYLKSQCSSIYDEIYYIFYMGYARVWFYNLFFTWSRLLTIILVFVLSYGSNSLPVAYRIIYMGFFLQYHLCYSISKRLWNLYLFPFYITLIIYSMIVLFIIYIYQFKELRSFQTSICFAHMKCDLLLSSLGIRHAYKNILITELFTPTAFIIFIVIHINFFHRQKRNLSSPKDMNNISSIRILYLVQWFEFHFKKLKTLLWCLSELHIYKILLLILCVCLTKQTNICLTNFILVFIFVISLFIPLLQTFALALYALVSSLHILMIMIIRLELFAFLGNVKNVCLPLSSSKSYY